MTGIETETRETGTEIRKETGGAETSLCVVDVGLEALALLGGAVEKQARNVVVAAGTATRKAENPEATPQGAL